MKKYLEYSDLQSNKFWYITKQNESLTVVFGKVGAKGQTQVKTFSSPADAEKEANKLIKSKIKKGYEEKAIPPALEQSTCTEKAIPPALEQSTCTEKAIPPAFEQSTCIEKQSQTIIKMPDAPKPKYHPKPTPPKDVKDDGKEKPWFNLQGWSYGGQPNPFDFEELRKVPPVQQPTKEINNLVEKETLTKTEQELEFENLKNMVQKHIRQGDQFDVEATFNKLKVLSASETVFQTLIKNVLEAIFSDFVILVSPIHLDILAYLLPIKHSNILIKEQNAKGVLKYIYDNYQSNLTGIHGLVDKYLTAFFKDVAEEVVIQVKKLVETIRSGGSDNIPAYKLPNATYGFFIRTFSKGCIKICSLNYNKCCIDYTEHNCDMQYHNPTLIIQYLTQFLKPKLQQMVDQDFFEGLTENYFKIAFFNQFQTLADKRLNEDHLNELAKNIEANLQKLEKSDEYDIELLSDTVKAYFASDGVILHLNTDRILALLKKYLYSGEAKPQKISISLIEEYADFDFNKWHLANLQFKWKDFDFKVAYKGLNPLINAGYEPAIIQKQEWDQLGEIHYTPRIIEDSINQHVNTYSYNSFTENDVFCETDAIIARAMSTNGKIYLRFKEESEMAYSQALDYLNDLMAKDYSKKFGGYWLNVYFVTKPEYYPEFARIIKQYPDLASNSHAFFRKAAMYESLHDKIRKFVELTMEKFHHCLDLQDEDNSIAGTFAAIALTMTDVKHMDMAIKFALETDDEHEFLASYFGKILQRHWGITPETAVAIALLQLSYQEQPNLSSQFYKIPQNLAALTDYFNSDDIPHKSRKIITLVSSLFGNEKYSLKKLKELFSDATDPLAKEIYANFHNLVLDALEDEVSGQPIIFSISPKPESEAVQLTIDEQDFIENPPCVITPLQAKKRGFDVSELETYDSSWIAVIFAPLTITNPYIFDAIIQFHKVQNKINPDSTIIWGAEQAYCFGKKIVIDFSGTPYQVGMGIYGKNQAQLIYGVMDFAKIADAMNKKEPDKEKLYALRKQHYYFDSPKGSPNIDYSKPGIMYLDEALGAGIYKDDNYRAIKQLEKITPDMGEVYDASLLFMAYMLQKKQDYALERMERQLDTTELKQVYQTAQKRLPQYQEYWQKKLAKL